MATLLFGGSGPARGFGDDLELELIPVGQTIAFRRLPILVEHNTIA
jgi:hypothetical protein